MRCFLLMPFFLFLCSARADVTPRLEAMELFDQGKYSEALDRFLIVANGSAKPLQKADAQSWAAYCLQKLGRGDEALEMAREISLKPFAIFCQMRLLKDQKAWDAILELIQDEDLEGWPEQLIYPALMIAGDSFEAKDRQEEAEDAFVRAGRYTIVPQQKAIQALSLGNVFRARGKMDQALEAYGTAAELGTRAGGLLPKALIARAEVFAEAGRESEAVAAVAVLREKVGSDPHWICAALVTAGNVQKILGNQPAALEYYHQAVEVPGAPDALVREVRTRIATVK